MAYDAGIIRNILFDLDLIINLLFLTYWCIFVIALNLNICNHITKAIIFGNFWRNCMDLSYIPVPQTQTHTHIFSIPFICSLFMYSVTLNNHKEYRTKIVEQIWNKQLRLLFTSDLILTCEILHIEKIQIVYLFMKFPHIEQTT